MYDHSIFGPADPAPHNAGHSKARKCSAARLAQVLAIWVVGRCLSRKDFTASEAWQAIPELRVSHRVANAVATALGAGVGGKGGLQLWRGEDGLFAAVRQNAVLAAHRLDEAELSDLAHELGLPDLEALARAILALPSVKPDPRPESLAAKAALDQPSPTLADTVATVSQS